MTRAQYAEQLRGHVVLREHDGRGLVEAVLARAGASGTHAASLHDHAHSNRTPSHVLDWSSVDPTAVVHNMPVANGAQGLADNEAPVPTTARQLSRMSLVELVTTVLDVRPRVRAKSQNQLDSEEQLLAAAASSSTTAAAAASTTATYYVADRRRHFASLAAGSGDRVRMSVGVGVADLARANRLTETLRYGFTFIMSGGATEVYSVPFDTDSAHQLLGANPKLAGQRYTAGDDLAAWEVDDVGAGVLAGVESVTIRRSMARTILLHFDPTGTTAPTANGVALATPASKRWQLLDGTTYLLTAPAPALPMAYVIVVGDERISGALQSASGPLVLRADRLPGGEGMRWTLGGRTMVMNTTSVRVGLTVGSAGANQTALSLGLSVSYVGILKHVSKTIWQQVQARGVRAQLREAVRKAAVVPADVAQLLPASSDFAAVDYAFEHFEWPAAGAAFLGFDAVALVTAGLASTQHVPVASLVEGTMLGGVAVVYGERILLTGQTDGTENGLYRAGRDPTDPPSRVQGVPPANEVVVVQRGTHRGESFRCTASAPPLVYEVYSRWPRAKTPLGDSGGVEQDVSARLLRTQQDGYLRYTFAAGDTFAVAASSAMARTSSGIDPYLAAVAYKLEARAAQQLPPAAVVDLGNVSTWEHNKG